jgi:phage terminase small subunit
MQIGVFSVSKKEGVTMNNRQKRFCDEYLIDCNATQAAIRAGYSPKTAKQVGQRLLTYVDLKNYIDEQLEKLHSEKTADAKEVLEYLTSVMRGTSESEEIVVEGTGDGCSEARTMTKAPSEKDRLKAAELLGKRHGLFTDKLDVNANAVVIFQDEDKLED